MEEKEKLQVASARGLRRKRRRTAADDPSEPQYSLSDELSTTALLVFRTGDMGLAYRISFFLETITVIATVRTTGSGLVLYGYHDRAHCSRFGFQVGFRGLQAGMRRKWLRSVIFDSNPLDGWRQDG